MSSLDHATLYAAEWNFAVFPVHWIREDSSCSCRRGDCRNPGKHPLTRDGFRSATKNVKQIAAWWREHPQAGVAVATGKVSGIVVLDVDPRHGGFDSLARYTLPPTMKARTGGGGEHYYFRYTAGPTGVEIRNSAGKLGAGLDVRGEGGYVVAPPSNHLQGVYEWEAWKEIAELPEELLKSSAGVSPAVRPASCRPLYASRIQDSHRDGGATIFPGQRNSTLASLAGSMRCKGFSREAITQALLIENKQRCRPPLETGEVRDIATSISRYKPGTSGESRESREFGESEKIRIMQDSQDSPDPQDSKNSSDSQNSPDSKRNPLRVWNLDEFLNQTFQRL